MISIKDIQEFQISEYLNIHKEAEKIHPKLLRRLSHEDLFNPEFNAGEYDEQYKLKIKPLLTSYIEKLHSMINSHLYDFIDGWLLIHPDGHYAMEYETGKQIAIAPKKALDISEGEVLIDIEIEDYIQVVKEMLDEYTIKPYWCYSYSLYGDGLRETLLTYGTGETYIKYNRMKYNGNKKTFEVLADIAVDINSLPFKINYPIISGEMSSTIRNSDLTKITKHHKVLHSFFETFGKDAGIGNYMSSRDQNGKIIFMRISN